VEYLSLFGIVFIIHLLAVMSPGPDFIMVVKNAIQFNRKTAIYTSLGISLGIAIHVIYSIAGVAILIKKNEVLFNVIKTIGAIYIIYIGYKTAFSKSQDFTLKKTNKNRQVDIKKAIKTGFITNIFNPKASLFFLSVFSIILPPDTPFSVIMGISAMLIIVTFLWFTTVSYIFTSQKVVIVYKKYDRIILISLGIILILLGINVLFQFF
jgi:RhtB (resistance to homoserine/threonine) family protein